MNALFEIVADALKKYAAEILAAVLFSLSLWKFPKLRAWLTKYKGEQIPQEETTKKAEAPKNVESISASSGYYERACKCERSAERWRRISALFSKLYSFAFFPFTILFGAVKSLSTLIIISLLLGLIVNWFFSQYRQLFLGYCICCSLISFSKATIDKFMSSRSDKALDKAKTLYERGAEHGEIPAMKRTAQLYGEQEKYSKAAYWYEKLAEQSDFEAMYSLVNVYHNARDYENAYI